MLGRDTIASDPEILKNIVLTVGASGLGVSRTTAGTIIQDAKAASESVPASMLAIRRSQFAHAKETHQQPKRPRAYRRVISMASQRPFRAVYRYQNAYIAFDTNKHKYGKRNLPESEAIQD